MSLSQHEIERRRCLRHARNALRYSCNPKKPAKIDFKNQEEVGTQIQDLLTDLMLLAEEQKVDFEGITSRAYWHYSQERKAKPLSGKEAFNAV